MSGQLGEMEEPGDPLLIHVISFLTADERNEIPDGIRTKVAAKFQELTGKVHNYINQKQKDRIAYGMSFNFKYFLPCGLLNLNLMLAVIGHVFGVFF